MMGDAQVQLTGNLAGQPELRFTPAGQAVCNFSVAVAGRRKNAAGTYEDGPTSFYRCTAWRELAENITQSLASGQRVVLTGTVAIREYKGKDGVPGRSTEVEVDDIGPSLRWATCVVKRATRTAVVQVESDPWTTDPANPAGTALAAV